MAWRSLRTRWVTALGSIIAILLGAALMSGALILHRSASAASPGGAPTPWALHGADLVVRMPDQITDDQGRPILLPERRRLTAEQVSAIRSTPGVTAVTVETPSPAYVVVGDRTIGDAMKRSWAHPWSTAVIEPFRLSRGQAPVHPDELVLDQATAMAAGIDLGDRVPVVTTKGTSSYRLVGVGDWPGTQFEHALFVADAHAAELGGDPLLALVAASVDRVRVAKELRKVLPDAEVTEERAYALFLDRRQAELSGGSGQFLLVMAVSALSIAAFVIASTLSLSVMQRRREIALLRTVGATPGRVRRLVIGEAAFLGLIGGLLGSVVGIGLGAVAIRFFIAQGMVSRSAGLVVGVTPLVVAVGVAVLTAILAGALPAWRAAQIPAAEAMRAADVQPKRTGRGRIVWGVLALVAAVGFVVAGGIVVRLGGVLANNVAGVLFLAAAPFLILAATLLGRALLAGLLAAVRPLLERSAGGFLAARQIRGDLSRAVGVTTPVLLMVSFACLLIFQEEGTFEGRARSYEQQLQIDLAVRGTEQLGMPPVLAAQVAAVPGVRAASGMINTSIFVPGAGAGAAAPSIEALAVDPGAAPALFRMPVETGSWAAFDGGGIAVARAIANTYGWQAGEQVGFLLPDGTPYRATVAAVFAADPATFSVLVPRAMVLGHLLEPYDAGVLVALDPAADRTTVAGRIEALRVVDPNVTVLTKDGFMAFLRAQSSGDTWIIYLFVVLIGGYASIAAINVLVSSAMARRRQFALLRLAGAQRSDLVRAVGYETAVIVLGGVVLGTVVAAVPLVGYAYIFTHDLWLPFAAGQYGLICAAALLVGAVGAIVPTRLVLRTRAVEALGSG